MSYYIGDPKKGPYLRELPFKAASPSSLAEFLFVEEVQGSGLQVLGYRELRFGMSGRLVLAARGYRD